MNANSEWLTVKQAAEMLSVSTRTIMRYMKAGVIMWTKQKHNGHIRILASSVKSLMA